GDRPDVAVAVGGDDEHPHPHPETGELVADALLERHVAPHHPVVLEGTEARLVHEPDLVERVLTGALPEHAEVGRVVQLERLRLTLLSGGRRRRGRPRDRHRGGPGQPCPYEVAPLHRAAACVVASNAWPNGGR